MSSLRASIAAELDAGPAARFRDRDTGSNQIVDVLIDVEAQLVVDLPLQRRAMERRAHPRAEARDASHTSPGWVLRMPSMMSVIWFQLRADSCSWRRPVAVNR